MNCVVIVLSVPSELQDSLFADLLELPFDGYEQTEKELSAFLPQIRWTDRERGLLEKILVRHGFAPEWEERVIPETNWIREWEKSLRPIRVEPFLIRSSSDTQDEPEAGLHAITIDPRMSFGTGYHESTRLALRLLAESPVKGKFVLDAGFGTGILSIAAALLGAANVTGYDTDPWAYRNAVDNVRINGVATHIDLIEGSVATIVNASFDLILANINRDVLHNLIPDFAEWLRDGGRIILSGLLNDERKAILETLKTSQYSIIQERREGEWWAVSAEHHAGGTLP